MSGARARALIVGGDGPEGRTPAVVAFLVAPAARTWVDAAKGRAPAEVHGELDAWVASLEQLAGWHRRSVTCPPAASVDGHSRSVVGARADDGRRDGLSTGEAARRLGVEARTVCRLLGAGRLTGRKVGRVWLVDPDSVERERERR